MATAKKSSYIKGITVTAQTQPEEVIVAEAELINEATKEVLVVEPVAEVQPIVETPVEEVLEAPAAAAEEVKEPVVEEAPVVVEAEVIEPVSVKPVVKAVVVDGNVFKASITKAIAEFCSKMQPGKPINADQGARMEQYLFGEIQSVLRNCPADSFRQAWDAIIDLFADPTNGALKDRYIFRFASAWTLSNEQCMSFQSLVNLIIISTDRKNHARVRKMIDMDRALAGINEEARNKIFSYYSL